MSKRDTVPGLGEKLKAARIAAGLTQQQAVDKSGVHQANLSQFEGDAKTPTLATLYKLAAAYGVDVCDLLPRDEKGQMPSLPAEEEPDPPAKKASPKKGKKK